MVVVLRAVLGATRILITFPSIITLLLIVRAREKMFLFFVIACAEMLLVIEIASDVLQIRRLRTEGVGHWSRRGEVVFYGQMCRTGRRLRGGRRW